MEYEVAGEVAERVKLSNYGIGGAMTPAAELARRRSSGHWVSRNVS